MKPRELQCIVVFNSTTEAMAFEQTAKEVGLGGRIIPIPTAISTGCGLSWKDSPDCVDFIKKLMTDRGLVCANICQMVI
jgi:hypothetical protein